MFGGRDRLLRVNDRIDITQCLYVMAREYFNNRNNINFNKPVFV